MCLITPHKEVKIAEQDMIVYKTMHKSEDGNLRSTIQGFHYEFDKEYETKFSFLREDEDWNCYDDLDSEYIAKNFRTEKGLGLKRFTNDGVDKSRLICVSKGFHSFATPERAMFSFDGKYECLVSCLVPKGSQYYLGVTDMIVSNRIKIIGILNHETVNQNL